MAFAFRHRLRCLASKLAIVGLAGAAGVVAAGEAALVVPPEIVGHWRPRELLQTDRVLRLHEGGASIGGREGVSDCRLVGIRGQSRSRWYLDLKCEAGRVFHLDINLVAESLLLAAQRPLGEAEFFVRINR